LLAGWLSSHQGDVAFEIDGDFDTGAALRRLAAPISLIGLAQRPDIDIAGVFDARLELWVRRQADLAGVVRVLAVERARAPELGDDGHFETLGETQHGGGRQRRPVRAAVPRKARRNLKTARSRSGFPHGAKIFPVVAEIIFFIVRFRGQCQANRAGGKIIHLAPDHRRQVQAVVGAVQMKPLPKSQNAVADYS